MKKVLTYGTYDLLHRGHINLLRRAKEMGDHLTVGLSTDRFNALKNKKSYYPYEERKLLLESIKYVDVVIPEITWEQKKEDITKYDIDILVMGDDWIDKFDDLKNLCDVVYLQRTASISTSMVKARLTLTAEQNLDLSND